MGGDEGVETIHDLFDAGLVVPPMDIENVNVGCTQFSQGDIDRKEEGLGAITDVVGLPHNSAVKTLEVGQILKRGCTA